jgi:hypothetical protein
VKPTVLVQSFFGLFRIFEVAFEDVGSFDTDFSAATGSKVVHIRYVDKFDGATRNWRTNVFWSKVSLEKRKI